MSIDTTDTTENTNDGIGPPPPAAWVPPVSVMLLNRAGNPELDLSDAPQSMWLRLTNRRPHPLHVEPGAHVTVRFRPETVRGLEHIQLGPESSAPWRLATTLVDSVAVVLLRAEREIAIAPGDTAAVHLQGIAGDPRGGTRATRVEVEYDGIAVDGTTSTGRHLLHLAVRRSKIDSRDLTGLVGAGSVATAGPFTAGFLDGSEVLNGGAALNTLTLRIANTSGAPLRLSADDDAATRIVLDYRVGDEVLPWGLLGHHGDHFEISGEPPGWDLEGPTLRRRHDEVWSRASFVDIELAVHTSSPPNDAQLVVRVENLPDHDDVLMVLLVGVGPTARRRDRTASVAPLQLWGSNARLELFAAEYDADAGATPTADATLDVATGTPVVSTRKPLVLQGGVAAPLRVTSPNASGDAVVIDSSEPAGQLRMGVHRDYAWIQSHDNKPLHLNPQGSDVVVGSNLRVNGESLTVGAALSVGTTLSVGTALSVGTTLVVGKSAEVRNAMAVRASLSVGTSLTVGESLKITSGRLHLTARATTDGNGDAVVIAGPEPAGQLRMGVHRDYAWIQSHNGKPLHLNPVGHNVVVGSNLTVNGTSLTVSSGRLRLTARATTDGNGDAVVIAGPEPAGQLRMGVHRDYAWIQSHNSKPLHLNPVGNRVQVGSLDLRGGMRIWYQDRWWKLAIHTEKVLVGPNRLHLVLDPD
ncbi:MAG: hypothetical protein AB7W59_06145 [Acidimicrobiia bacterium]